MLLAAVYRGFAKKLIKIYIVGILQVPTGANCVVNSE